METDKLILELFALALRVNRETDYAVFCRLEGHVNWVELSIGKNKHTDYSEKLFSKHTYLPDDSITVEDTTKGISEAIEFLNTLLK